MTVYSEPWRIVWLRPACSSSVGHPSGSGRRRRSRRFVVTTLGERAWRVLGEVCEEVIAVGKADDALEVPFAVLDDGSEERAPVFGVIAGLRAARHDAAWCCRSTPAHDLWLLRELRRCWRVPQTGPLPGAYAKAMLPELEARVAAGELSLRGVNQTVLEVDEKLLRNVNTRMDLLAAAIADWARERADVRAVVVVGSRRARMRRRIAGPDLDAVSSSTIRARSPDDEAWIEEFGTPVLSFLEPTAIGEHVERRVLYEGGEDVDFPLIDASKWRALRPTAAVVLGRGYRVLYDDLGIEAELEKLPPPPGQAAPDAAAFRSSRATSGTTRSGPRGSSGAARSSRRSSASTGT